LLGYASVGKLLGEVTSEEISEWQAYFIVKEDAGKQQQSAAEAKQRAKANNR